MWMSCGLSGNSGRRSMTTLRGGGGNISPGIVITFSFGGSGTFGGAFFFHINMFIGLEKKKRLKIKLPSRITWTGGSTGMQGTWRIITK